MFFVVVLIVVFFKIQGLYDYQFVYHIIVIVYSISLNWIDSNSKNQIFTCYI